MVLWLTAATLLGTVTLAASEVQRAYNIPENAPTGTTVGFLDDPPPAADTPSYLIVYPPESQVEDTFSVNAFTGEIKTRMPLDYETRTSYVFIAIPMDGSDSIRVVVDIADRNDNKPVFREDMVTVELSEYAKIGSETPLPHAIDLDSGVLGVQRYEIVEGNMNDAFRLVSRRVNDQLYLDLVVNQPLDRETRSHYELLVAAFDGGSPSLKALLHVNVTVLDANDNYPKFVNGSYLVKMDANASVGSELVVVEARDPDEGVNGLVQYFILPSPADAHRKFAIDRATGSIRLVENVAQETQKAYELLVVARDLGLQPMESTAFVSVQVQRFNSKRLQINVLWLGVDGAATISEDAPVDTLVARLSTLDPLNGDQYANSDMALVGGDGKFALKRSEDGVYVLTVVDKLDREAVSNYTLAITATDRSTRLTNAERQGRMGTRNLTLTIADVNDSPPRFAQAVYETEVKERANAGSSVLQTTATDFDAGDNGRLIYSLTANMPEYADWFVVDPDTGLITVHELVDCEVSSKPELTVWARDGGTPSLNATASVIVHVLGVNDNPPVFQRNFYNASLPENTAKDTCFLQVAADDPDCGLNAEVRYQLTQEGVAQSIPFAVDSRSGTVCLNGTLDYEQHTAFQFEVEAVDGGGLTSRSIVLVHVQDVNDHKPAFYPAAYNVSLRMDTQPGQPILVISARDGDSGEFGRVRYSILAGNEWGLFRLQGDKGELYLEHSLARGGANSYYVKIAAVDGGNQAADVPALVTISVLPHSYPSPVFQQKLYQFSLREDTLPGIAVGSVKAEGPALVLYSLYSGDPYGYFAIDAHSGAITVAKDLDHDSQASVLLNVQAAMGDPPAYNHTQVQVQILDVNDNAPIFPVSVIRTSLLENHDVDIPIYTAQADDKDSGDNGRLTYQLIANPDSLFVIHPINGDVTLVRPLDYESRQNYILVVEAKDGGVPVRSANLTIYLSVQDFNDHDPVLSQNIYRATVREDATPLTDILQLQASDGDSGMNAQLSFELTGSADFAVYADSGVVYVRKSLDREAQAAYELRVTVVDHGVPKRQATGTVVVSVLDVNDNVPNCGGVREFHVTENSSPAIALIGRLDAHDPDNGANGTVFYALSSDDPSPQGQLFMVEAASGQVSATQPLDYETEPSYRLFIVASDGGTPPRSSTCSVLVLVDDVNDNAPLIISPHQNRLHVREEQPRGSEVFLVKAIDPDRGENGTLRYSFLGAVSSLPFAIDVDTGVVTNTHILDYESGLRTYELTVLVEDKGNPPKSSLKALVVEIVDIDDGSNLQNETISFEVSETVPVGSRLGLADPLGPKLEEVEKEESLKVSYEIVSGNSLGLFDIDRTTSELYLLKPLDYESVPLHFLQVTKRDHTKSFPTSSLILVKLYVQDANDNAPFFPENPVIFSVPENANVATVVWTYNATDRDGGNFGRVRYNVEQQLPESAFAIDPISGQLWVAKQLDFERYTEYMVVVSACDQAPKGQERKSSVTSRIYVVDLNDNAPRFVSRERVVVFEDEPVGYPLLYVVAADADWLENGRLSYHIVAGNEAKKFALNETSGALVLQQRLARDEPRNYVLNIEARDHGTPALTATQNLEISMQSVNVQAPRFKQSVYHARVPENAPAGTRLLTVEALDGDGTNKTELVYILPQGVAGNKFRLDEKSGALATTVPLDREEQDSYILTVHAVSLDAVLRNMRRLRADCWWKVYTRDSAYPSRYDASTVLVTVTDVNDQRPIFGANICSQVINVTENVPMASLHRLLASDPDNGTNQAMVFSLSGGNTDGKFRVNPTTGDINCDALDFESTPVYNLSVTVHDTGTPHLSDTCQLIIALVDVNDEAPSFEKPLYLVNVPENAPPGTEVVWTRALDLDQGSNGRVLYSLSFSEGEQASPFAVDSDSGTIRTAGPLNFDKRSNYSFLVVATDQGDSMTHNTSARVAVTILDANTHAPIFLEYPNVANVSLPLTVGQRVAKVVAQDADGPGKNSDVYYGLQSDANSQFSINPQTGVIIAKGGGFALSPGHMVCMLVTASDMGTPSLASTGLVQIRALDASGRWQPTGLHFAKDRYETIVSENAVSGTEIIVLSASLPNAEYRIVAGNDMVLFQIDSKSGRVTLARQNVLDYETEPLHYLSIVAQGGAGGEEACTALLVSVADSNDEPQFVQQQYFASVYEGQSRGTFVAQVTALDYDLGENAAITYSIMSGNVDNAFAVQTSGAVVTNGELDREIAATYRLVVMATDGGRPLKTASTTVNVRVVDVNDNGPSFPPGKPITLSESLAVGTLVGQVTANDVDLAPILTYSLLPGGNGDGRFYVESFSGRLFLAKSLDYESRQHYDLLIQVSDSIHTAVLKQNVRILDENDCTPEFLQQFYQVSLPENTPGGVSIVKVTATDGDSEERGKIRYSLSGVSPTIAGFWMDPDTGEIFTNRSANFADKELGMVQLTVEATDQGQPPRTAVTTVQVLIVSSASAQQPKFQLDTYSFSVSENAPQHSVIGNLQTLANGHDNELQYGIRSGDDRHVFAIDQYGNLLLSRSVDREVQDEYRLDVSVHTKANSVANSSAVVMVKVVDINDNAPVFDPSTYKLDIHENLPLGSTLLTSLAAPDLDAGDNGRVTYNITSGNEGGEFLLGVDTGLLVLDKALDFETTAKYRLIISASDHGQPPRSAFATVDISIIDDNDHKPLFPVDLYVAQVAETSPLNTPVFTAKATDEDQGEFGVLSYQLTGDGAGMFKINPVTGEVQTSAMLDYEDKTAYTLAVLATDKGGLGASVAVHVLVQGVDEFYPVFDKPKYTFPVSYDASIGDIVGSVRASDLDKGVDGQIQYALKDPSQYFGLHATTGTLSVLQPLKNFAAQIPFNKPRVYKQESTLAVPDPPVKEPLAEIAYLVVVAKSGADGRAKVNTTTVEIQLGHFTKKAGIAAAALSPTTITIVTVVLVLILVAIIVVIAVRLRRRKPNQRKGGDAGSAHYAAYAHAAIPPLSQLEKNGHSGFGNGGGITSPVRPPLDISPSRRPPIPAPPAPAYRGRSLYSVSNLSGRSSNHESIPDEPDEEMRESRASSRSRMARSAPDSGILPDDAMSVASDVPNAHEYLTSLGVDTSYATPGASVSTARLASGAKPADVSQIMTASAIDADVDAPDTTVEGVDVQSLIYAKLSEVSADDGDGQFTLPPYTHRGRQLHQPRAGHNHPPQAAGSPLPPLSQYDLAAQSVGQLHDWGPSYQPLSHVFTEIAKMKESQDTLRRRAGADKHEHIDVRNSPQQAVLTPKRPERLSLAAVGNAHVHWHGVTGAPPSSFGTPSSHFSPTGKAFPSPNGVTLQGSLPRTTASTVVHNRRASRTSDLSESEVEIKI